MLGAVALSITAEISSGPSALVVSKERSSSRMSSSVHSSSEGQSEEVVTNKSDVPKGGMTQHERSDTRAKSMRDLFLWGLVWVSSWTA